MQFHKRGAAVACTMLAAVATAVGCGGDDEAPGSKSGAKSVSSVKIGFAQRVSTAPYYGAMEKAAKELSSKKGFKLVYQDAGGDPTKQIDLVNTMVAQGVDAIVVNAVSADTEKTQMLAIAKKVPLLFVDTPIPDVGFTAVQSDNVKIGADAGKLMAERVGDGKTLKLAILNGGPEDVDVGPARRKGFLQGLKEGGVTPQIVGEANAEYAQDVGVTKTEDLLTAHPDIQAIFGYNDAMVLGALQTLKKKGNKKVLLSGLDGQKEALAQIKQGGCEGQYVSSGLNSPSLAATKALEIAVDVATGKTKTDSYPKLAYTDAAGIGCKNVGKYYDPSNAF